MWQCRCANRTTPPPTPPYRKSGLPDLRTIRRDPGEPGLRGQGERTEIVGPRHRSKHS
jgi:hypothetical protein